MAKLKAKAKAAATKPELPRLVAVMGFDHPEFGSWLRGEEREMPVGDAATAMIRSGYLRAAEGSAPVPLPAPAAPEIPAGDSAQLTATMAFSRPILGSWARGETRTIPVDAATIAAIRAGYLRAVPESPAARAAEPAPATTPDPADVAGSARVKAVMAFSGPRHGAWPRGEIRTVPVDDATIALVESGYLEPVWDTPPPLASGVSVQLPSPNGQVTVYPAIKAQQEVSGVDPVWAAAAAAHGNANPGRGAPRLRKRRH